MEIFCLMFILILNSDSAQCSPLIVPEDVPAGFAAIFGFSPRIFKANDHRFGFGFRLGNHADFQILYELGPQTITRPLQSVSRIRSPTYRDHLSKRRPIVDFLLRIGILQDSSYKFNNIVDNERR